MHDEDIAEIADELSALLEKQIRAIAGRCVNQFTEQERYAYEERRNRIAVLRAQLDRLVVDSEVPAGN